MASSVTSIGTWRESGSDRIQKMDKEKHDPESCQTGQIINSIDCTSAKLHNCQFALHAVIQYRMRIFDNLDNNSCYISNKSEVVEQYSSSDTDYKMNSTQICRIPQIVGESEENKNMCEYSESKSVECFKIDQNYTNQEQATVDCVEKVEFTEDKRSVEKEHGSDVDCCADDHMCHQSQIDTEVSFNVHPKENLSANKRIERAEFVDYNGDRTKNNSVRNVHSDNAIGVEEFTVEETANTEHSLKRPSSARIESSSIITVYSNNDAHVLAHDQNDKQIKKEDSKSNEVLSDFAKPICSEHDTNTTIRSKLVDISPNGDKELSNRYNAFSESLKIPRSDNMELLSNTSTFHEQQRWSRKEYGYHFAENQMRKHDTYIKQYRPCMFQCTSTSGLGFETVHRSSCLPQEYNMSCLLKNPLANIDRNLCYTSCTPNNPIEYRHRNTLQPESRNHQYLQNHNNASMELFKTSEYDARTTDCYIPSNGLSNKTYKCYLDDLEHNYEIFNRNRHISNNYDKIRNRKSIEGNRFHGDPACLAESISSRTSQCATAYLFKWFNPVLEAKNDLENNVRQELQGLGSSDSFIGSSFSDLKEYGFKKSEIHVTNNSRLATAGISSSARFVRSRRSLELGSNHRSLEETSSDQFNHSELIALVGPAFNNGFNDLSDELKVLGNNYLV